MLQGVKGIKVNIVQKNTESNYAYYPVLFDKEKFGKTRDEIAELLEKNNIYARKYFYPLTNSFSAYNGMFKIHSTPVAEKISNNILCLPLYSDLSVEDVKRICYIILKG